MNRDEKPFEPSPEALDAARRIVRRARAWQSGRTLEDRPLPTWLRIYSWFTSLIGLNLYTVYEIHQKNTRLGVCWALVRQAATHANARWRLW